MPEPTPRELEAVKELEAMLREPNPGQLQKVMTDLILEKEICPCCGKNFLEGSYLVKEIRRMRAERVRN